MDDQQLKYPIGKYAMPESNDLHTRMALIESIRSLPSRLIDVVIDLDDEQLDTPYRPEGWTVRQVVHHVADSHMNSYVRFHWGLSEDTPTIKAYDQNGWASLPDAHGPISMSLELLDAIHVRWTFLMDHMEEVDFARQISHPEWKHNLSLDQLVGMYAWHGEHHKAHITSLADRMDW